MLILGVDDIFTPFGCEAAAPKLFDESVGVEGYIWQELILRALHHQLEPEEAFAGRFSQPCAAVFPRTQASIRSSAN